MLIRSKVTFICGWFWAAIKIIQYLLYSLQQTKVKSIWFSSGTGTYDARTTISFDKISSHLTHSSFGKNTIYSPIVSTIPLQQRVFLAIQLDNIKSKHSRHATAIWGVAVTFELFVFDISLAFWKSNWFNFRVGSCKIQFGTSRLNLLSMAYIIYYI